MNIAISIATRKPFVFIAFVLASLTACTGTSEARLPTLLAVAVGGAAQPQVALVRTALTAAEESAGGFAFLESSRQALAAPALDFDVTERNGSRRELVVLSRIGDATSSIEAYLDFFNLQGVAADAPDAFAPSRARRALSSFTDAPASFCPEAVQTSRTGRFVAVFSGTSCGGSATLDIFDTQTDRALPRISGGTFGLVNVPPYLDQQTDTLYYLQQKVSDTDLIAVRLTLSGVTGDFPTTTMTTLPDRDQRSVTQLGTTLLVLYPRRFVTVPLATPSQTSTVDTQSDARRFIDNLSPSTARDATTVLILGDNRLTVHTALDDTDEQSTQVTVDSATYDPLENYAYLVSEQQIVRFDLLRYDGNFSGVLRTFLLPELVRPGPITWFKGIVPAAAP